MPVYDFRCPNCGIKEVQLRYADLSTVLACECGQQMRKLFSPPGIIFKGSGFYSTDRVTRHSVRSN